MVKPPHAKNVTSVNSFECVKPPSINGEIMFKMIKHTSPVVMETQKVTWKTRDMEFLALVLKLIDNICMVFLICAISSIFNTETKQKLGHSNGGV